MKENFSSALVMLLKHEGGFVNHPKDPGGMTNLGVTKNTWEAYVGHPVTEADMRALTASTVAPMYRRKYWDACQCDDLPEGLDYAVFDFAVNSGPGRAAKTLQTLLSVPADGDIGPKTLAAIETTDLNLLVPSYNAARHEFLRSLPTYSVFKRGWDRRIEEVAEVSGRMVG